jgi:hypothetical protein
LDCGRKAGLGASLPLAAPLGGHCAPIIHDRVKHRRVISSLLPFDVSSKLPLENAATRGGANMYDTKVFAFGACRHPPNAIHLSTLLKITGRRRQSSE